MIIETDKNHLTHEAGLILPSVVQSAWRTFGERAGIDFDVKDLRLSRDDLSKLKNKLPIGFPQNFSELNHAETVNLILDVFPALHSHTTPILYDLETVEDISDSIVLTNSSINSPFTNHADSFIENAMKTKSIRGMNIFEYIVASNISHFMGRGHLDSARTWSKLPGTLLNGEPIVVSFTNSGQLHIDIHPTSNKEKAKQIGIRFIEPEN